MSILSKKYNIPAETVNKMISDGVISCSWKTCDEVHKLFAEGKSTFEISELLHMSQRNVQYIVKGRKK